MREPELKCTRAMILIALFALGTGCAGWSAARRIQWQRWEHVLTAAMDHPNPYASIQVDVTFTGPGGASLNIPAFWDGGRTWRFRAAFPAAGTWRWRTACNDAADRGLHGQSGRLQVAAYSGDNALYRHGDLRVSPDKRYLVHADGTPFLWMGDTGWYAARRSSAEEWRDYVDTRARQRFSVLQIIAVAKAPAQEPPASAHTLFLDNGMPDPAYWRALEEKFAYANDRGLAVLLTGVGAYGPFAERQMEPAFARYLAGRFAGHMIIFSPSMDQRYEPQNDQSGTALERVTTHLVTQHPGTDFEAAKKYHDGPYARFCGLQSGHHGGKLIKAYNAARAWTFELWNREPVKPVIDIEAMYDAYGHDQAPNWREQDARKLGWIAWLSGSRGYTYGAGDVPPKVPGGAGGVWSFNSDPAAYDNWRKAVAWPSATQMTIMRDFFGSIDWWRLAPAPGLVQNQAEEEMRKMAVSRSAEGDLIVAYLPDNDQIILDLKDAPAGLKGKWFNPLTGNSAALNEPIAPGPAVALSRPAGWTDAVLLLTR